MFAGVTAMVSNKRPAPPRAEDEFAGASNSTPASAAAPPATSVAPPDEFRLARPSNVECRRRGHGPEAPRPKGRRDRAEGVGSSKVADARGDVEEAEAEECDFHKFPPGLGAGAGFLSRRSKRVEGRVARDGAATNAARAT